MAEAFDSQDITTTAASWVARLDRGELSTDELMALRDWATANPAHLRELERLADIWEGLDTLSALRSVIAQPKSASTRTARRFAITAGIAAGIAVLAVAAWLAGTMLDTTPSVIYAETYATAIGEQRSVETADGSRISLNTDSQLAVDYSERRRRVRMDRGEVFFDVSPDDSRQFVVETDFGNVVVTGTSFQVRVDSAGLEVLVQEGRVQVENTGTPDGSGFMALTAGQLATVSRNGGEVARIEPDTMTRKLDWRDGMLMFDGQTLEEVVREVGRYTSIDIIIDDPVLRQRRIGGYFRVGEIDDLLATLQSDFAIDVDRVSEQELRLSQPDY